ncbi:MAG: efflux RND transporter periplasmic adaptor subunit [Patescibacteria group bacterium]
MAQSILAESRQAKRRGLIGFFLSKKFLVSLAVALALGGAAYYVYARNHQAESVIAQPKQWTVKSDDLQIAIQSDGKVVSKDQVSLSFPVSGNLEVDNVYVKEGDRVKKGDKIASVKTESLQLDLRNAYTNYQSALANLEAKQAPPTDAEISSAKAAISQAQISLDQAKISLEQAKSTAQQQVDNAQASVDSAKNNLQLNPSVNDSTIVRNAYSSLYNSLQSLGVGLQRDLQDSDNILGVDNTAVNQSFKSILGATNPSTFFISQASYGQVKALKLSLDAATKSLDSNDQEALDRVAKQAADTLRGFQTHLNNVQLMLNATIVAGGLTQAQLDGFRSTIASDISSLSATISSLDNTIQAVSSAKSSLSNLQIAYNTALNNLKVAQTQTEQNLNTARINVQSKELALEQANNSYQDLLTPAREVDLAAARAQLASAAISVDRAKYNMSQATLISPIDGVISALNYKVGDIIISNSNVDTTVATIINTNTLFIEANVEEASISKLKVGEKAVVTFDAIDGLTLNGEISFISLTSTTSANGIVTYLVRVIVDNPADSPVREGMTAAINFVTAEAKDVLIAPISAVRNINGSPAVEMVDGEYAPVTTGFTDGTSVAILTGLKAGDVILY